MYFVLIFLNLKSESVRIDKKGSSQTRKSGFARDDDMQLF